jgi:hypothetical protein
MKARGTSRWKLVAHRDESSRHIAMKVRGTSRWKLVAHRDESSRQVKVKYQGWLVDLSWLLYSTERRMG